MAKTRIRPNADDGGTGGYWTITGGSASVQAALSDDSDATYVRNTYGSNEFLQLGLGTLTLSAGNDIAGVSPGLRAKRVSTGNLTAQLAKYLGPGGSCVLSGSVASLNGTSAADVVLTSAQSDERFPDGSLWTQTLIDALEIYVQDLTSAIDGYLYEAYADVYYYARLASAVTISGGTPVTTTSKPTFNLTFTSDAVDADQVSAGWNQLAYEVKVFTDAQYGAGGFDPSTSTPFWTTTGSGSVAFDATAGTANVTAGTLPNDTYRVYVRAIWNYPSAVYGAWAYTALVVNISPTDAPTTTATLDNANGRVTCSVTPITKAGHSLPLITLERSSDAGATWEAVYGGTDLAGAFGVASVVYDYLAPRGGALKYRASVETTISGNQMSSLWTTVDVTGTIPLTAWNIKCPKTPALNLLGAHILEGPKYSVTEDTSVMRPKGRTRPVVVSMGMGGRDGSFSLDATTEAEWNLLMDISEYPAPVLVESSYGWTRWIRILDRSWSESGPTPKRVVSFGYVEVAPDV